MFESIGLFYIALYVIAYSVFTVSLKPAKDRLVVFFWANVWAYIGYLGIFLSHQILVDHPLRKIEDMLFDFTFINIPFYLLMAIFWVGSLIVLNDLFERFDVSLVVPVTQITLLFTTIGYLILGIPFSWVSLLSVVTVFVGSVISAFDTLSWKDPLGPLKRIPISLLLGGTIQALLNAGTNFVTYICTHPTSITKEIVSWVTNIFHHIYRLPFSFHEPFYYNVGVRFFIALIFFVYMIVFKNMFKEIFYLLLRHFTYIAWTGTLFLLSVLGYQSALFSVQNANTVLALTQLSIPLILIIGNIFLKEKMTQPKIVGCVIIVLGGFISLLA